MNKGNKSWLIAVLRDPAVVAALRALVAALIGAGSALLVDAGPAQGELGAALRASAPFVSSWSNLPLTQSLAHLLG